jgi:hypothetical protein
MTKDEDDWLSDFLELAQASDRQSPTASEKDYQIRLKLLSPRIERARDCDVDEALAKKVAASEALAGQGKFDAAADQLDAAFALAGHLLETAAAGAADVGAATDLGNLEPASVTDEPPAGQAPENLEASLDAMVQDLPSAEEAVAEKPAEESPVGDLDAMLEDLPSGDAAAVEKPVEENPLGDLDAMLEDLPSGEAAAAEKPVEENPLGDLDAMLEDLPSGEAADPEAPIEIPAPNLDTDPSEKQERP